MSLEMVALMTFRHRRIDLRWGLTAGLAVGVIMMAGLIWYALVFMHSSEVPASRAAGPASPPARICGNQAILAGGPASPPRGAVTIPAGDDSGTAIERSFAIRPDSTYWFAAGIHTLGTGELNEIIPAKGDTFVGAPGAILDGQGDNHYAFDGNASNVTIKYLTVQDFGHGSSATSPSGDNANQAVVNHDSGHDWVMKYLTVKYDAGAGVIVGTDGVLSYSCLRDNGQYGFQGIGNDPGRFGATHLTIDHDEITGNNTWNWESKEAGCGCSGADKFWNAADVSLTDNYIHNNQGPGIWADTDNANFDVQGNDISDNDGEAVVYETSYNLRLADNSFAGNALVDGAAASGFPDPAVYISEAGGDSRVPDSYGASIDISGNKFINNWGGVVLWEDAGRYCGSQADTSAGFCTLVDPSAATASNCGNHRLIGIEPYYGDCRWKTQNVRVSDNDFIFNPADIGPACTPANYCGFNGIFSHWGSVPPYDGTVVEKNITFDQNNHFASNTYSGPWRFMVLQQGNAVSWATWRAKPYDQDAGSTLTGSGG
jgi:parallel beta-helix repeat protein